jgi:putative spermidine/putrescine transport system substrate-binding protein
MKRRQLLMSGLATGMAFGPAAAQAARAVCYNCPPEWADWGGMLRLLQSRISLTVPPDNKNSGQSLAALIAERARPVADVVYLGGQVGPQAREAGDARRDRARQVWREGRIGGRVARAELAFDAA